MKKCPHAGEGENRCCLDALKAAQERMNPKVDIQTLAGIRVFCGRAYSFDPPTQEYLGLRSNGKLVDKVSQQRSSSNLLFLEPESEQAVRHLITVPKITARVRLVGGEKTDCAYHNLWESCQYPED